MAAIGWRTLLNLHEVISADDNYMIYAGTPNEIATRRKSFIRKWRLKCRGAADGLEEAGEQMFIFGRLPDSQWRPARTTNAIERLHEEFKRRINTQAVLPSAETAAMLFSALLASARSPSARSMVGKHLPRSPPLNALTLLLEAITSFRWRCRYINFYQLCDTTNLDLGERIWRYCGDKLWRWSEDCHLPACYH